MKTILSVLFLFSCSNVFSQGRTPEGRSCNGMLYVDVMPASPERCTKLQKKYCCYEGGTTGYYQNGTYHYDVRMNRYSPGPVSNGCETVIVCTQIGVYQQSCGRQTRCGN